MLRLSTFALVSSLLTAPAFAQVADSERQVRPAPTAPAAPGADLRSDDSGENRMLRRINALRRAQQKAPLRRDEGLDLAAETHSRDMAAHQELVHVSSRTGSPADRVRSANVTAARIAQNVARQANTRAALEAIFDSEAHRAQLLDENFTHIGLAAIRGEDGVYVTQVLANIPPPAEERLPPPAVAELEPPASAVELTTPAPPAVAQNPTDAPGAPVQTATPQPRPVPVPSIRVPAGHRRVAGYWLHQHGRWWYFPVPRGTPPGTVVRPDLRFTGPPPGMRGQRAQPPVARPVPPPSATRPPPPPRQPNEPWRSPRRNNGQVYWY